MSERFNITKKKKKIVFEKKKKNTRDFSKIFEYKIITGFSLTILNQYFSMINNTIVIIYLL